MLVRTLFGPFLQTGGVCLYSFHNYSLNHIHIWVLSIMNVLLHANLGTIMMIWTYTQDFALC